jgi:hypothetical protein
MSPLHAALAALAMVGVMLAVAVVFILILSFCDELLSHWKEGA